MIPGASGPSAVPVSTSLGPAPEPQAFLEALENPDAPGQYLVEIAAYKGGESRSGGLATLTEIPLSANPPDAGVSIGLVDLLYADRHWIGEPDDADKPNVYYEGRVNVALTLTRVIPLLPEDDRRTRRQFGQVEIANGDGRLDPIVESYAIDGRRVRVLFGPYFEAYSKFRAVADVLGVDWEGDETSVRLNIRDQGYSLDSPLQETLYAGTGGAEGTADIEGKPKPLLFGRCRNVTPILVDPTNLIYQVNDGAIFAIDAVYDRGATLTASGTDVSGYAALAAQAVSAGEFATALDSGLFKLGALPSGLVTSDVRGDADPTYQNTLDQIALRILLDRHGLQQKFVDVGSFASVAALGGEMGIFISPEETPTTAEVMSRLVGAAGGWWGAARDGRIRAGRLTAPAGRSPKLYLDQYDIISLSPEDTPVPRWRQGVGYEPNWTIQRGEDLAGTVTAARRQKLKEPFSVVQSENPTTRTRHAAALDPDPLPSLYESETDATALADYLLALHGTDRRIYTVRLKRLGYRVDVGQIVHITWPRYVLQNGRNFLVVGMVEEAGRRGDFVTLRVWG